MNKILLSIATLGITFISSAQVSDLGDNVGIGIDSPKTKLHVRSSNTSLSVYPPDAKHFVNTDYDLLYLQKDGQGTIGPSIFLKGFNEGNSFSGRISLLESGGANGDLSFLTSSSNDYIQREVMRISHNGNVGVGTSAPRQKLELYNANSFNNNMEFQSQDHILLSSDYKNNKELFGSITWESGGRRRASIVATREHSDADFVGLAFFTKGTDGPGSFYESMRISHNGNVGIGTISPDSKLSVNGKIHTKEVKVDLIGWSDFVFYDNYKLSTLTEVENYIKEKGHLKDIPSAKEVKENGILLGEMNSKLLQKIEELTLYIIQQEKDLKFQNVEIKKIKTENEKLTVINKKLLDLQSRLEKLESEK